MKGQRIRVTLAIAAFALCAAVLAGCKTESSQEPTQTAAQQEETAAPESSASESKSDENPLHRIKLLDISLESETQWEIYRVCEYNNADFAFLMAIGCRETGFDSAAAGDGGGSIGIFQINVKWHLDRLERLGITDLQDPVQCAAVALDLIRELESRYGFEPYSHALLMGYNMGPANANKAISSGTTSTAYSRDVMTFYQNYLGELEATP